MNSLLSQINENAAEISIPGIRVFANRVNLLPDGINLTIGEPDFPTPEPVKQAAVAAITGNRTGYSHNAGLLSLRQSVSRHFHASHGFSYDPEHEILITNGASSGIDATLRTILRDGDEVILPAPIYSGYDPVIRLAGGVPVYLDTSDTDFKPDPGRLKELITPRTKAVILNYPSNPTGATLDRDTADRLANVLSRYNLFVISDEIYSENVYDGTHISFASYPSLRDRLILIHGLSKSHSMTGWRVGFVLAPRFLTEQILKVHMSNSICASLPSQYAAIEALENCRDIPKEMNQAYIERRDYAHRRLNDLGLDVQLPTGAFYLFPSVAKTGLPSLEFAEKLLEHHHVAVVPGSSFTSHGEGFIRISYATSMSNLKEGLNRLEKFIHGLKA